MDLRDLENNTRDGVHIASLAGAWVALVSGFGGLRHQDSMVSFTPRLPEGIARLRFSVLIRGRRLHVEVTHPQARYELDDGEPLDDHPLRPGTESSARQGADPPHPGDAGPAPAQPAAGPRTRAPPGR